MRNRFDARTWLSPQRRPLLTLLITGFTSIIANNLTALAVPWFVLATTGSAGQMGLTAFVTLSPSVFMMFFGGAIADRMSAWKLSIFADLLSGITVVLVPILFHFNKLNFPLLLLLMFLGAVFDTPGNAARSKMVPVLSDRAGIDVQKVTSFQGAAQAASVLFGAILAGVLIAWLGATNVLWINAATFAISAAAMLTLIPDFHVERETSTTFWQDIREGMAFVGKNRVLKAILIFSAALNGLMVPMPLILLPFFAKVRWDDPRAFGAMISGFGVGAIIGSVISGWATNRWPTSKLLKFSLVAFSAPTLMMITLPNIVFSWLTLFVVGIGAGVLQPTLLAVMYRITPQEVLGRVSGVLNAGSMLAAPFGVVLVTVVLDQLGVRATFATFSLLVIGLAVWTWHTPAVQEVDGLSRGTRAGTFKIDY